MENGTCRVSLDNAVTSEIELQGLDEDWQKNLDCVNSCVIDQDKVFEEVKEDTNQENTNSTTL